MNILSMITLAIIHLLTRSGSYRQERHTWSKCHAILLSK